MIDEQLAKGLVRRIERERIAGAVAAEARALQHLDRGIPTTPRKWFKASLEIALRLFGGSLLASWVDRSRSKRPRAYLTFLGLAPDEFGNIPVGLATLAHPEGFRQYALPFRISPHIQQRVIQRSGVGLQADLGATVRKELGMGILAALENRPEETERHRWYPSPNGWFLLRALEDGDFLLTTWVSKGQMSDEQHGAWLHAVSTLSRGLQEKFLAERGHHC